MIRRRREIEEDEEKTIIEPVTNDTTTDNNRNYPIPAIREKYDGTFKIYAAVSTKGHLVNWTKSEIDILKSEYKKLQKEDIGWDERMTKISNALAIYQATKEKATDPQQFQPLRTTNAVQLKLHSLGFRYISNTEKKKETILLTKAKKLLKSILNEMKDVDRLSMNDEEYWEEVARKYNSIRGNQMPNQKWSQLKRIGIHHLKVKRKSEINHSRTRHNRNREREESDEEHKPSAKRRRLNYK